MLLLEILASYTAKKRDSLFVVVKHFPNELGYLINIGQGLGFIGIVIHNIHILVESSSEC